MTTSRVLSMISARAMVSYYYLNKVAKLGGYMNRALDPPPGNMVMWRGFSKLSDIRFGFNMAMKMTCG